MSATPPSTTEYVRFHARHRPDAIALIDGGREIDYATFHRDVGRFTRALREFKLPRGSTVAVACESLYVHWLLLLACENLGIATASFLVGEGRELEPLLARVRLVLCSRDLPRARATKCHLTTTEWLDGVFASAGQEGGDGTPRDPLRLDEPQRLRRSSGTTGGYKMMVATRRVEEQRVWNHLLAHGFTPNSRLLVTTPFTVGSMYSRATGCLRLGATSIRDYGRSLARSIVQHHPSHVRLFQFQMKTVLDELPQDFRKPADLTVMVGAAPLADGLRQALLARLASRISYTYSSNETGSIAMVDADGVVTPRPGAQLEIVDDAGVPVTDGQVGEVRVQTLAMVDGYLDDPERSAQKFQDGWFCTGDAGMMVAPGRLKLLGRRDDLLNIGGRKISPAAIEALVEKRVPVEEVGVTSRVNREGIEEVCIAVSLKDQAELPKTLARIESSLPKDFGKVHISVIDTMPRTPETGKIQRRELKKLFS